MSTIKRKALGRGLAALIPGAPRRWRRAAAAGAAPSGRRAGGGLRTSPSRTSTRRATSRARCSTTRASRSWRRRSARRASSSRWSCASARRGGYELIAGERRWRAAQRAGLHEVPAVVRDVAPTRAFEMAMVENLQREDLNPIEEAAGYQRLIAELGYTQESLAARVGKDRTTITNALRLLRLPDEVRDLVDRRAACRWATRARCWASSRPTRWCGWRAGSPRARCRCARSRRWSGASARTAATARGQRRAGAPVGVGARSGRAPVARHRRAGQGRRGGPGTRVTSSCTTTRSTSSTRSSAVCCHHDRTPAPSITGATRACRSLGAGVPIRGRVPGRLLDQPVQGRHLRRDHRAAADRHRGVDAAARAEHAAVRGARHAWPGCARRRPARGSRPGWAS